MRVRLREDRAGLLGGPSGEPHHALDALHHHVGVDVGRADGVHRDPALGDLDRDGARQPDHRVLRRGVAAGVGEAAEAGHRGDGNDATEAALDHAGEDGPGRDDDALVVHRHHLAELGIGRLDEGCAARGAGVVDEDLDGADGGEDGAERVGIGDIDGGVAVGEAGGDRALERRLVAAEDDHAMAGIGERRGDGAADAASSACHHRQPRCHSPFSPEMV